MESNGNLRFKLLAIGVIAVGALIIPFGCDPINPKTKKPVKQYPSFFKEPGKALKMRLHDVPGLTRGLDLQGGDHIVISMDPAPAVVAEATNAITLVKPEVIALVPGANLFNDSANPRAFVIDNIPADKKDAVKTLLETKLPNFAVESTATGFKDVMTDIRYAAVREEAVERSRGVIELRINSEGVAEPVVQRQGEDRIVVEVAGNENSAKLKKMITESGRLEWHLAQSDKTWSSREAAMNDDQFKGILPPGTALYSSMINDEFPSETWMLLEANAPFTGSDLRSANPTADETNRPAVGFTFNVEAGSRFHEFTEKNIKKKLVIVLNEHIVTAPVIQSAISATGIIHGSFSDEQVEAIVGLLNGGSMPATPHLEAITTVGPSLGAKAVRDGIASSLLGLLLVAVFMAGYYRLAGLNAITALLLNLLITLAAMTLMHAVLTVPGIAGMILTIGMAVDANVLVFERIREELRGGKTVLAAIDAGFSKAWSAIFDSNLSTLLAAFVLLLLGQGPVKGFAVTLTIGLLVSVFTAVGVSKVIFQWLYAREGADHDHISIGKVDAFSNFHFNLMKYKLHWLMLSLALLAVGIFAIGVKPLGSKIPLGLDLSGGTEIEVKFRAPVNAVDVENQLKPAINGEYHVSTYGAAADNTLLIKASLTAELAHPEAPTTPLGTKEDKGEQLTAGVVKSLPGAAAPPAGKLDLNAASLEQLRMKFKDYLAAGVVKGDATQTADQAAESFATAFKAARDRIGLIPEGDSLPGLTGTAADAAGYMIKNNYASAFVVRRHEGVGAAVGNDLRTTAMWAVILSTLAHLIYLWIRFELRFSVGAIVAMIHDVLITLGIFCLAGPKMGIEMSLPVLAAFLTLTGYSINDTIVVFDRIRETLKKRAGVGGDEDTLFNQALNETLSRTLLTSLATFLAVLAMFVLGGPALRGFSFVMLVGIVVGTYSSIYIASPWAIAWRKLQDKWFPAKAAAPVKARR
jgi:SecD/SecF fusion protein